VKFFLDTANLEEIKEASSLGVLRGVTTNPSLVSKEKVALEEQVEKICALVQDYPVSVEVLSTSAREMVAEARRLAGIASNIVIKIPICIEGLKAVYALTNGENKVPCNVTLVFSFNQALLAAIAGAAYVSPFLGRIDDIGGDGVGLVEDIVAIFEKQKMDKTEVIAASIRHPRHVHQVAAAGAHIATVPFSVLKQMAGHPLTDLGIEKFEADWARALEAMNSLPGTEPG